MISIIVPVYNVEKYIHRCIESILAQTYSAFELILVDDGSIDRCGEICDGYAKKDTRIIAIHQNNQGVSAARNAGLAVAKGKYIIFCDGDDEIDINYLWSLLAPPDSFDLVVEGFQYIDSIGNTTHIEAYEHQEYEKATSCDVWFLIGKYALSSVWGKRFKRSIIDEFHISFDHDLNYAEDTLFVAEYIVCSNSVIVLHDSDYRYRKHDEYTLNGYSPSLFARSQKADKRILAAYEQKFPGTAESQQWKLREWPILRGCLFGTLNNSCLMLREKRKILHCILNNKYFPRSISELMMFLPKDGKALILTLRFHSATLLILFHRVYLVKQWFCNRNKE